LASLNEEPEGGTCIPDEVQAEIHALLEELDLFLGQMHGGEMEKIALELKVTRLVITGHIPLPCSLTEAALFLGTHNISSLPLAVLRSPAMGETTDDGRGYPVVKLKPGIKGRGHEAAPVVRRQPPSSSAQRLVGTRVPRASRCLQDGPVPVVAVGLESVGFSQGVDPEFILGNVDGPDSRPGVEQ